jgi:transcriptional regulator with XRE-family HTH domain
MSLLERGLRQPTLSTLVRLAEILEVAPATMVARTAAIAR